MLISAMLAQAPLISSGVAAAETTSTSTAIECYCCKVAVSEPSGALCNHKGCEHKDKKSCECARRVPVQPAIIIAGLNDFPLSLLGTVIVSPGHYPCRTDQPPHRPPIFS
jgi:hypothetical protein